MAVKNEMRRWVAEASKEELEMLATAADTTVGTIRQLAGGYRHKGKAVTAAPLAVKIELATKMLAHSKLPPVMRGDLCSVCAGCDLYKKHKTKE